MSLTLCVATMKEHPPGEIQGWIDTAKTDIDLIVRRNFEADNLGVVGSYQWLYKGLGPNDDLLVFAHDDVIMREEGWDSRVEKEFEDPKVGIVGFGGALAHGSPDLYKVPYRLNDLARFGYMSNVDDAEFHGERYEGSRDVSVLDGFALCIRRSLLDRIGGWSLLVGNCDFFNYDYAICALARRFGYRIRLCGVRCHHLGGGTSVGPATREITSQSAYDKAHRWFYEEFRDVMPAAVKP